MAVTYTKAQREYAKANNLSLITLATAGFEFQGPAPLEEVALVSQFIGEMYKRRAAWLKAQKAVNDLTPAPERRDGNAAETGVSSEVEA